MPDVHWAMTSLGLDTMNIGAPITGMRKCCRIGGRLSASNPVILAIPVDEAWNPFVDGRRRLEAEIALDRADIGEGFADVSGLHRLRVEQRFLAGRLLQALH